MGVEAAEAEKVEQWSRRKTVSEQKAAQAGE